MGIKGLWTVLTPFSEKKSLHEIRGQTLAVDLAGWVCDSQNVTDYYIQPKLYLRNLFFRTIYLILADVDPVFVLEGDAPELKRDVMAARNAIQFRGAAPRIEAATNKRPDVGRRQFKRVLKECETLLKTMGVTCIKGRGEAEATCAQLNSQGSASWIFQETGGYIRNTGGMDLSDDSEHLAIASLPMSLCIRNATDSLYPVVSQDSDCFAYGARRVYRNFSVSSAAGRGAMQGSIDCYDADKMFQNNGFGRNKMVALALLCGCDYGVGACGSSITTVLSFLHTIPDIDIIPRLISWVSDPASYEEKARWASTPGRCDRCGHVGRTHAKNGCPVCATHRGCSDNEHKSKVAAVKRELSLRNKALSCGMSFPEPKVMKEFLNTPSEHLGVENLRKPTPSLVQFVRLMSSKLDWSERYSVQKFLPLLTKWHLQDNVTCRTIKPVKINKKRNPKGVPSYEVEWADVDGQYEALISDDQFEDGEDRTKAWTSTERQDLVRRYYPDVVEAYEESIKKPVQAKKARSKKKDTEYYDKPKRKYKRKVIQNQIDQEVACSNGSVVNLDFNINNKSGLDASKVSVKVLKLKRKIKQSSSKGQKTIHSFIGNKRRKSGKELHSLRSSFKNMSIVNDGDIANAGCGHLLSMIGNDTNDQDNDLSDIVDSIVTRAPLMKTARLDHNLVKLVFNKHSTPRKSVLRKSTQMGLHHINCSTPQGSPLKRQSFKYNHDHSHSFKVNTSYFFDKLSENVDAFELSFSYKHTNKEVYSVCESDKSECSLPDVHL